jgi:hypothetical protein
MDIGQPGDITLATVDVVGVMKDNISLWRERAPVSVCPGFPWIGRAFKCNI